MSHDRLLIYGTYGYTGELIARQAVAEGRSPVLSGRNASKVAALAQTLGLDARPFDLDADTLAGQLTDIDVVLHCAGPFIDTAPAMVDACIATGTHYLDITGEIEVFEHIFARHATAREAGAVLCPGAGFDVVPTDCLAAALAEELPDATSLALGFDSRCMPVSRWPGAWPKKRPRAALIRLQCWPGRASSRLCPVADRSRLQTNSRRTVSGRTAVCGLDVEIGSEHGV